MNKNKIILIACLMGVALIGLVILQVNWIRHDLAIRQEKFTQQATEAVNRAIEKIETRESVHFISTEMEGILDDSITGYFSALPVIEFIEPPEPPIPPETGDIVVNIDSADLHNAFTFISKSDTGNSEVKIVSRKRGPKDNVTVSVKTSDGKTVTSMNTTNSELAEIDEQLRQERIYLEKARELSLRNEKVMKEHEKVRMRAKKLSNVMEKMAVEYERRDFKLAERLAPPLVDSLVGIELKNNGIYLPYSIKITAGRTDSVLWKRTDTLSSGTGSQTIKAKLFPGDIINKNDAVAVIFSDTFRFFISSMWMMLLSSVLFTGIIIFAFSYTIMVIFRQKKLSEIKNDFINNMTHEFKTPIATIRLASEAISNAEVIKDAEKVRYYTGIIRDENERMNNHVENILQIAQFDKHAFAPELEVVDMNEVISDTILMMQLQAEQKGGKIVFNNKAESHTINADRRYIPLVILNLIDNAIKYTETNPEIIIETVNKDGWFIVSVTDNGIGMSADKQKKIFEKFYRVTSGNLHNVKGFGLGLSYVKAIVAAHNGEINVQSEPGKGSRFEVKLPNIKS